MSGSTAVCGTCSNGASPSQNNCYASISGYTCINGGSLNGSTCYIYILMLVRYVRVVILK